MLAAAPGGLTFKQFEDLGVRRVSVGASLARAAWGGFIGPPRTSPSTAGSTASRRARPLRRSTNCSAANRRDFGVERRGFRAAARLAADVPALEALQRAAYARNRALLGVEPLPLQVDYREIVARMEVWLFGPPRTLLGVLALEAEPDALLIWSVATAPKRPGAGLGDVMLDFAHARARELKLAAIRLYTGEKLRDNIDWYQRRGFAIDRVEALADRRIVHMSKRLG